MARAAGSTARPDPTAARAAAGQRVLLAGATGLVGQALLDRLLPDPGVAQVVTLGRRAPARRHARLTPLQVDFTALPALPPADAVLLALGTTIKVAGSQAAFRAVDFDANLAVARAALAAGARRAGLVSALGADARSAVFYNRVKGELEDALRALPFEALVIARPSLLLGDRDRLGQPVRPGERAGQAVTRVVGPLIPAAWRPIPAERVAAALLAALPAARGVQVLDSGAMQKAGSP
jgi:uncharacterized protein YbjT (DUF2867 family)